MPRTGITRDHVFAAADALAHEGAQPTVKLVRDRIGGSFSTITPHLADWKDERGGRSVASVPDMPEGVTSACRSLWASAWKAGQDAIQTERDGLSAAKREMEQEHAELAHEITDLEGKLDTALAERDALTHKLAEEEKGRREAQEAMSKFQIENARLEERVANTEKRAEELRVQVERLEGELARLAQAKEEPKPKERPAPREKQAPKEKLTPPKSS
jgi:hypothetical protein